MPTASLRCCHSMRPVEEWPCRPPQVQPTARSSLSSLQAHRAHCRMPCWPQGRRTQGRRAQRRRTQPRVCRTSQPCLPELRTDPFHWPMPCCQTHRAHCRMPCWPQPRRAQLRVCRTQLQRLQTPPLQVLRTLPPTRPVRQTNSSHSRPHCRGSGSPRPTLRTSTAQMSQDPIRSDTRHWSSLRKR